MTDRCARFESKFGIGLYQLLNNKLEKHINHELNFGKKINISRFTTGFIAQF